MKYILGHKFDHCFINIEITELIMLKYQIFFLELIILN